MVASFVVWLAGLKDDAMCRSVTLRFQWLEAAFEVGLIVVVSGSVV